VYVNPTQVDVNPTQVDVNPTQVRRALLRLAAVAVLVAAGGVQWLRAVGALEGASPSCHPPRESGP
jgi:hypothetical protein